MAITAILAFGFLIYVKVKSDLEEPKYVTSRSAERFLFSK